MSKVSLEIDGQIAIVRLIHPDRLNALTANMLAELEQHLIHIENNEAIRALIITGEGDRVFCAGADIQDWSRLAPRDFARHWVRNGHRVFDRLARIARPTIAAMNGHALGGGLELAGACDIRLMTTTASIGLPETSIGIVPGWSGTQRLSRLLPEPILKEMVLFGRRIDGQRCLTFGFVSEITDDVEQAARTIALQTTSGLSPRAIEIAKNMLHAAVGEDRSALIDALGSAAMGASDDRVEGINAFSEKRSPVFTGK